MRPDEYISHLDNRPSGIIRPLVSIVITCRAESWPTLIMTLQAIQEDCLSVEEVNGPNSWECIVVFNQAAGENQEAYKKFMDCVMRKEGAFRAVTISTPSMCKARNAGVYASEGRYVYIGDSHQLFCRDFFLKMCQTYHSLDIAEKRPIGILHSAIGWMSGIHRLNILNSYTAELRKWFWGSWGNNPSDKPFMVPMMGTSFLFEREWFLESGGYNDDFTAYGGDEAYINLKAWRLGKEVWVAPKLYAWHLADQRRYRWTNEDLWFNTLLAAYTIGGRSWLEHQYKNYVDYLSSNHSGNTLTAYMTNLDRLKAKVLEVGKDDYDWINQHAKYSLEELMKEHSWK